MGRLAKQLVIGFIYLVIIGAVGYGLYDLFTPDATCSDGIQNQGEEGVDCGTVCGILCSSPLQPLGVSDPRSYQAGTGTDILVELKNPNAVYGAHRVDYEVVLIDGTGAQAGLRRGFTYANPLQTRYLVLSFPGVAGQGATARFTYDPERVQWLQATRDFPGVTFSVSQERLEVASGSASYSGIVRNDSTFAFDEVDVSVILLDASGSPVGVGATVIRTLPAGGIRAFTVQWPFAVAPVPVRARVHVSTNVFNNANFIREYGAQERFQGF